MANEKLTLTETLLGVFYLIIMVLFALVPVVVTGYYFVYYSGQFLSVVVPIAYAFILSLLQVIIMKKYRCEFCGIKSETKYFLRLEARYQLPSWKNERYTPLGHTPKIRTVCFNCLLYKKFKISEDIDNQQKRALQLLSDTPAYTN